MKRIFLFRVKQQRKRGVHTKRRKTRWQVFREYLWPTIGWMAFLRLSEIRLKRRPGSAHDIALGVACGVAVAFTPFLGFHFILAALLAYLMRGNIFTSALGTFVGNPWTFPFIWLTTFELGKAILGEHRNGVEMPEKISNIPFKELWENFGYYFDSYLWPMTVGSIPLGIAAGAIFYLLVRSNVDSYRLHRSEMLAKRKQAQGKKS